MTTFFAGQPLTAQDLEDLRTFAVPLMVVKTADESVTSSTTPQDDNELTLTVAANAAYKLDMHILLGGTGTTGDFEFRFNAPAGSRISASAAGLAQAATAVTGDMNAGAINNQTTFPTSAFGYATVVNPTGVLVTGNLIVGSTAGALTLRWNQAVSSATPTTVLAGSSLTLTRYA